MTDPMPIEPETEDVPSDDLVAIAVAATDLRPAALRGIAEMLEDGPERRMVLAQKYREHAATSEERAAREQALLDALFALPGGEWVLPEALAKQLRLPLFDVRVAIDSLRLRGWPICSKWAPGEPEVYRLRAPNAQARLVGGADRD